MGLCTENENIGEPKMNLADPELELIDPTPNIHSLLIHFDQIFFWTKLLNKVVVRWSKRMYSCAGYCSYERQRGNTGVCDIVLSEPLLKLRPRKDLVETLLHEMIHAYLFITKNNKDRDGHGPVFKSHMYRINRASSLNITIYHNFHEEVKVYLTHWWRCNGRCQKMSPHYGVIRRPVNRAPGPSDFWWENHRKTCGGTFIKVKEPEKPHKTKKTRKSKENSNANINNNSLAIWNKIVTKGLNKENNDSNANMSPAVPVLTKSPDIRNLVDSGRKRTNSASVIETVRNVWVNKQIPSCTGSPNNSVRPKDESNLSKHRSDSVQVDSPPKKMKKIDDYFKSNASSILKDVYGEEFIISQSSNSAKLKAVTVGQSSKVPPVNIFVDCPSCNAKVYSNDINKHLDECLNKNIIQELSKDFIVQEVPNNAKKTDKRKSKDYKDVEQLPNTKLETNKKTGLKTIVGNIPIIPPFKSKTDSQMKIQSISKDNSPQICPSCGDKLNMPLESHLNVCLGFFDNNTTIPEEGLSNMETVIIDDDFQPQHIKVEPGTSKQDFSQKCPCCGKNIDKLIELHLDECLGMFDDNSIPTEGCSGIETIVIDDDDDDILDETQTFNATGTKFPCPCCLKMIENADMNDHLNTCIQYNMSH